VPHSARIFVIDNAHTNTIEGFFGNLKTSIRATYKHVSHRWLQSYLDEFAWRYNHRFNRRAMFRQLPLRAGSAR
jgi:transposase